MDRTTTVSKLTKGLALTEPGIKVIERTIYQGIVRMFACHKEILKENKYFCRLLNIFRSLSGIRASPSIFLDVDYDTNQLPTLEKKVWRKNVTCLSELNFV
jgi:hypothetical protein